MDGPGLTQRAPVPNQVLPSALESGASRKADTPTKIHDAAQQFEALMLEQILKSAHPDGGGWLGSGEDQSGSSANDFAEQQFATMLAKQGGLGLASMISAGLQAGASAPAATPRADVPTAPHAAAE